MAHTESGFFESRITLFVNHGADRTRVRTLKRRLTKLSFNFDVVECDQWEAVSIYHRGDVISGPRLNHFLEYSSWLRAKSPVS